MALAKRDVARPGVMIAAMGVNCRSERSLRMKTAKDGDSERGFGRGGLGFARHGDRNERQRNQENEERDSIHIHVIIPLYAPRKGARSFRLCSRLWFSGSWRQLDALPPLDLDDDGRPSPLPIILVHDPAAPEHRIAVDAVRTLLVEILINETDIFQVIIRVALERTKREGHEDHLQLVHVTLGQMRRRKDLLTREIADERSKLVVRETLKFTRFLFFFSHASHFPVESISRLSYPHFPICHDHNVCIL